MEEAQRDRLLDIAVRVAAVLVVGLVVYTIWTYVSHLRSESENSVSARSIVNLQRAVRLKPQDPARRVLLAEALAAGGRIDDAITQLQAALTIDKEYSAALADLAKIAMQRQEWKTAEAYWRKLIEVLEGKAAQVEQLDEAYYGLGVTYLSQKRYEEAADALKRSLAIRKDASDSHYMLSIAYRELDYPDKQKQELEICLAFDPKNAQANYDLGLLTLKAGDEAKAAELFRVAADNAPGGIDLPQQELDRLSSKASVEERIASAKKADASGKLDGALAEARIALALAPEDLDAARLVARLWERKKDDRRAYDAWQRVFELSPQDTEAAAASKRLEASLKKAAAKKARGHGGN